MKGILTITLMLLASTIYSTAQSAKPTPTEPKWERFQSPADEFLVETPVKLEMSRSVRPTESRSYLGISRGTFFYVFSDPVAKPDYYSIINGHLKMYGQGNGSEKPETTPRTVSFDDPYGYHQRAIIVKTAARIYIALTVSKNENDEAATRFMSSFGIGDNRLEAVSSIATNTESTVEQKEVPVTKGGGMGSGSGSGAGSGNGTGNGSGIGTGPATPPSNPMAPLRILTKPRPGYTEMARFYNVQGTILIRVTFLASGQIGSATPTTTLPFGLTQTAIDASKKIQFEPSYRDGQPITVVKTLEYSYSIY